MTLAKAQQQEAGMAVTAPDWLLADETSEAADEAPEEGIYPTRDGKPMAESDKHADIMVYCKEALRLYYAELGRASNVYVSGNNFVYWEEGNPRARTSPDVYVVFGVEQRQRNSYMAWKEDGNLPAVVIEITSEATHAEDVNKKLPLYERVLKVPEYFQFDPTGDYLVPRLQGYRLVNGLYARLEMTDDRLHSEQLGLDLVMQGETLRLYDPERKRFLPTLQEAEAQARNEAKRAEAETARAEAEAQARARLEADNERLRADLEAVRRQLRGQG